MLYLKLFIIFFKIGLFGFGGGYAIVSLIQDEIIGNQWLTAQEMTDIIAISQTTPGPLAINCATYVGYSVTNSVFGAIIATFAVVLPSTIIMLLICKFVIHFAKNKYINSTLSKLRPTVLGLIAAAILFLCNNNNFVDYKSIIIFLVSLGLMFVPKMNPIFIIILAGIIGVFIY